MGKKKKRSAAGGKPRSESINRANLSTLDLATESDVEQKLLKPLLSDALWLNYNEGWIKTKEYLPPTTLDKGAGKKKYGYFPDYSIWVCGVPVLIVEAKSPTENVEEGFREAQLYAHALNKRYPTGVNPVRYVIASNGLQTLYGFWDSADFRRMFFADTNVGSKAGSDFRDFLRKSELTQHADSIGVKLSSMRQWRPINFIGGEKRLDAAIKFNSFADDLFPLIKMFFDSDSPERIDDIIERAYVTSDEITQYDRLLEVYLSDRLPEFKDPGAKLLSTKRGEQRDLSKQILTYPETSQGQGQLQLLIGPVGAGKSLFVKRYQRFLQPADQRQFTFWSFLDFNRAPDDLSNIEKWACETFIESFQESNPSFNLHELSSLRRIFAPAINKRDKGPYALLKESNPTEYAARLSADLADWVDDPVKLAGALCRFLIGDTKQIVVVVFDNVDRRDREQQLRIFQVAQWFKSETRSFCLLTLRDETYERYKNEPPLDAFLNSVHFYIRPPRFTNVVRKRLELVLDYLVNQTEDSGLINSFTLPNGIQISYPKSKIGEYLRALYVDLFHPSRRIGGVLEALTGQNVRAALKMFTDIIVSGHLDERGILSTVEGGRGFAIGESTVIKILMRTTYKYFADDHGYVTNIFSFQPEWDRPNNFIMIESLEFLQERRKNRGDIGIEGYFSARAVVSHLTRMGFVETDVMNALERLLERGLIMADHMRSRGLKEDDLVKIHASGFIHLRILTERLEYLGSLLPEIYMFDRDAAVKISELWDMANANNDISVRKKYECAKTFEEYLSNEYNRLSDANAFFAEFARGSRTTLGNIRKALEFAESKLLGSGDYREN